MSTSDTTNIDDLPRNSNFAAATAPAAMAAVAAAVDKQIYNPNMNINMDTKMMNPGGGAGGGGTLNMNEFITGLQKASSSGMTTLPMRDVPRNTDNITNDAQTTPNFVPPSAHDYIRNHAENTEAYLHAHKRTKNRIDTIENIYDTLNVPILIAVLYFAFQLPVMRTQLMRFIPSIFNNDGNYNLSGLLFVSILFSSSYFMLTHLLNRFVIEQQQQQQQDEY